MLAMSLTSATSQAGLGWLILASAVEESSQTKKAETPKSELESQVDAINLTLPTICRVSKYSSCWNQFDVSRKIYTTSNKLGLELQALYSNLGYNVKLVSIKENSVDNAGSQLVFDFSNDHQKYLFVKSLPITMESLFLLSLLSTIPIFLFFLSIKNRARVREVRNAYENSKEDLIFWNKTDETMLLYHLDKNNLPSHWSFNIKENKIKGISFYNGSSIGNIARSKRSLVSSSRLSLIIREDQFQSIRRTCWALMNDQSILGKDLAVITPTANIRVALGMFLRGSKMAKYSSSRVWKD